MTESTEDSSTSRTEVTSQEVTDVSAANSTQSSQYVFNLEDFRNSINNPFIKSLFVGIHNDTGENCFATVIIQMLRHNKNVYEQSKKENTILSKIIDKFEKLRTRSTIAFTELTTFIPNFNLDSYSNDPIIFYQSIYGLDKSVKNTFNLIAKLNDSDQDTELYAISQPVLDTINTTKELYLRRINNSTENCPQLHIQKTSYSLILHAQRNNYPSIDVNYKRIAINKFIKIDTLNQTYQLESIILRYGDTIESFGHYTIISNIGGTFFLFNDSSIQLASSLSLQEIEKHAVIYIYTVNSVIDQSNNDIYDTFLKSEDFEHISPQILEKLSSIPQYKNRIIASRESMSHKDLIDLELLSNNPYKYYNIDFTLVNPTSSNDDYQIIQLDKKYKNIFGTLQVPKGGIPSSPIGHYNSNQRLQLVINYLNGATNYLKKFKNGNDIGQENISNIKKNILQSGEDEISSDLIEISNIIIDYINEQINNNIEYNSETFNNDMDHLTDDIILLHENTQNITSSTNKLSSTICDDCDDEYSSFFSETDYDWKVRASTLDVDIIPLKTYDKEDDEDESESVKQSNKAKRFIENLWKSQINENAPESRLFESVNQFANRIQKDVDTHMDVPQGQHFYEVSTIKKIVGEIQSNGTFTETHKRGGSSGKMNDDIGKCLICTALDFPLWSGQTRLNYLKSKHGPLYQKEETLSVSTVNDYLRNHLFVYKTVSFSPKARNTYGARISRYIWSYYMRNEIKKDDVCLVFIDESAVVATPSTKSGRGFVGVTPTAIKGFDSKKLTLLTAVIPGYGTVSRWFNGSLINQLYSSFIIELESIIRTTIGSGTEHIVIIQDNCHVHAALDVTNALKNSNVLLLNNIPYSPETNFVVENYFGRCKGDLGSSDVPHLIRIYGLEQAIIMEWEKSNAKHGTAEATYDSYRAWDVILDLCLKCAYMGRGPYKNENPSNINSLRTFKTYRAPEEALQQFEKDEYERRVKEDQKKTSSEHQKHEITLSRFAQAMIKKRVNENKKKRTEQPQRKYRQCRLNISPEELAQIKERQERQN